jgi:hypothetical protein
MKPKEHVYSIPDLLARWNVITKEAPVYPLLILLRDFEKRV